MAKPLISGNIFFLKYFFLKYFFQTLITGLIMQVIQEIYVSLESGDREEHFTLSVFKTTSKIKLFLNCFSLIAYKPQFSDTVSGLIRP